MIIIIIIIRCQNSDLYNILLWDFTFEFEVTPGA